MNNVNNLTNLITTLDNFYVKIHNGDDPTEFINFISNDFKQKYQSELLELHTIGINVNVHIIQHYRVYSLLSYYKFKYMHYYFNFKQPHNHIIIKALYDSQNVNLNPITNANDYDFTWKLISGAIKLIDNNGQNMNNIIIEQAIKIGFDINKSYEELKNTYGENVPNYIKSQSNKQNVNSLTHVVYIKLSKLVLSYYKTTNEELINIIELYTLLKKYNFDFENTPCVIFVKDNNIILNLLFEQKIDKMMKKFKKENKESLDINIDENYINSYISEFNKLDVLNKELRETNIKDIMKEYYTTKLYINYSSIDRIQFIMNLIKSKEELFIYTIFEVKNIISSKN